MKLYVLDTDTLTLYQSGHPNVVRKVDSMEPTELSISIMSVDEQLSGWYSMTRKPGRHQDIAHAYLRLGETVVNLAKWRILPYTESAIGRFAHLVKAKLNVGGVDLRIGAIALEHSATVVSRNLRDFQRIPGVLVEDWSV